MPLGQWVVTGVLIPCLVPFLILFVARRLPAWNAARFRAALCAVALGTGYIAGHYFVARLPFPPIEATARLPWLVGLAVFLVVFLSNLPPRFGRGWLVPGLLATAVVAALFEPIVKQVTPNALITVVTTWLGLFAALFAAAGIFDRAGFLRVRLWWVIWSGLVGVALIATGSLTLGRLGFVLMASVIGMLLGGEPGWGASLVLGTALGALVLDGWLYSSLPTWVLLGLVLATAGACVIQAWVTSTLWPGRVQPSPPQGVSATPAE